MRTVVQKPKAAQHSTSAKPAVSTQTHFRQNPEVSLSRYLQRTIGNHAVQRLFVANAAHVKQGTPSNVDNSVEHEEQYLGQPCQSTPVPSGTGLLNRTATAFMHTFNILWSNASVHGTFRPATIIRPNMIRQYGPSFSMGGRVQAPQSVTGYRLGVIQQVIGGQLQADYNSLTTGAPWKNKEWTCGSGLDIAPGSTPPWYDAASVEEMAPVGRTGIADDPGIHNLRLVVDDQGEMGGTLAAKLAAYRGCQRFRSWLVIEAPGRSRQAVAWAEWVANYDITYNTSFTSISAGPPTTSATATGSSGWMTSLIQAGAGPTIPTSATPGCTSRWVTPTP